MQKEAHASYELAKDYGLELKSTNPTKLGMILNRSVFTYEVLGKVEEACSLAKDGFDSAINDIDELTDDEYKDATTIM